MDRPLHIRDVYNMSLENNNNEFSHITIVTQFSCNRKAVPSGIHVTELNEVGCTAVQFHNVHNVTLKGISLAIQAPNISGIAVQFASNIHIQLNITCSLVAPYSHMDMHIGIWIYDTVDVQVYSLHVQNFSNGLVLYNANNIYIIDAISMYSTGTSET